MRPLNIKLSAFGPYASEVNIPMSDLGDKGLYLITGDTGAGKTTIFDAICFALYGEASGANRESSMFRSKYADDTTPTYVELSFEHNGKEYRIERNPDYIRAAKKGDGTTTQKADAKLYRPDGAVITKVKDVNTAVEDILGLNKSQFSQIAMLAQGDFMKLLLAETKERMTIFRKLFKTAYYSTLQERLDRKRSEVSAMADEANRSIAQYISEIKADEDNVLNLEVIKAKEGNMTSLDILALMDKLINEDLMANSECEKKVNSINESLKTLTEDIQTARKLISDKKKLEDYKEALSAREPDLTNLQTAFDEAKENLKGKDLLVKKSGEIKAGLEDYEAYDQLIKKINEVKADISSHEEQIKSQKALEEKTSLTLESLKKEKESLEKAGENLINLTAKLEKKQDLLLTADDLKELYEEFKASEDALKTVQDKYIEDNADYEKAKASYDRLDMAYRNGQAGILAKDLKDGMKCPVCGSTSHPVLASLADNVPTDMELEEAKEISQKAHDIVNESAKAAGAAKANKERIEKDLLLKAGKLLSCDDLEKIEEKLKEYADSLNEDIEALNKDIHKENASVSRKKELDEIIPSKEENLKKCQDGINTLKTELASLSSSNEELIKQAKSLKDGLSFDSREMAQKELSDIENKAIKLQTEYDEADFSLKEKKEEVLALKTSISDLEKVISESKSIDLKACIEEEEKQEALRKEAISLGKILSSRIETNTFVKTNLEQKSKEIGQIEANLQWVKALADTANGRLSGKEKIMLETYIQTTYFDRIINRANRRLLTMSSGQYELVRQSEASNNRSQSGLELEVIDHYNGSRRSVKTLSGGESFMASLSLALGLSDEVQSNAGGIRIDSMFVDEGFGSLDPDSLSMAYNALAGLTEGNKLVGIISHVGELKEKIDKQIVVTKEKSGGSMIDMLV